MVKGYEFAKDQYVLFRPRRSRRWRKLEPQLVGSPSSCRSSRSIRFYFDKTYYLAPDKAQQALRPAHRGRSGRPGAAASAAGPRAQGLSRDPAPIATCSPCSSCTMQPMCGAHRGRCAEPEVSRRKLKLAQQLIDQQTAGSSMRTSTRTSCARASKRAIQKKVEGKEISVTEVAPRKVRQGHRSHGGTAREFLPRPKLPAAGHASGSAQGSQARRGPAKVDSQGEQAQRLKRAFLQVRDVERVCILPLAPRAVSSGPAVVPDPEGEAYRAARSSAWDCVRTGPMRQRVVQGQAAGPALRPAHCRTHRFSRCACSPCESPWRAFLDALGSLCAGPRRVTGGGQFSVLARLARSASMRR